MRHGGLAGVCLPGDQASLRAKTRRSAAPLGAKFAWVAAGLGLGAVYLFLGMPQDAFLTLIAVLLAIIGIIRNLSALGSPPDWEEFQKSMVFQLVAVSMASAMPRLNAQLKGLQGSRV